MPASTYLGNMVLNSLLRGVAFTVPARVYISLHTADPGLTGVNEVTIGAWPAYTREDPANGGAVGGGFSAPASKATENAQLILWPAQNGAGNITITHIGIWDAATGGNFLHGQALSASRIVQPTDEFVFNVGQLDVSVT